MYLLIKAALRLSFKIYFFYSNSLKYRYLIPKKKKKKQC